MALPGSKPGDANVGSTAAASAAAFLSEARDKIQANDTAGALICLRAVSGLAGCPPDLRLEACKLLAQTGDTAGAIECYVQAGQSYLTDAKDYTRARQAFQSAHSLDVHNLDVVFMLGQADVAEGRTQDGLAKFIDVLRKSNLKHVNALFEAGCIYQSNGQFDQAMLAFKKVLDRDKNHVQASLHIGQLHQSKDNLQEAISHYIQAAQIARECQHWGSARQIASMVLALDAQNQKARLILADLEEQGHGSDDTAAEAAQSVAAKLSAAAPASAPAPTSAPSQATAASSAAPSPAAGQAAPAARPAPAQAAPARSVPPPARPAEQAAKPQAVAPQVAAKMTPPRSEEPKPAPAAAAAPAPAAPTASAAPPASATPVADAEVARARQMLAAIEVQRQAAQADLQLLLSTREELQKALAEQRAVLETASMRKQVLETQIAAAAAQAAQAAEGVQAAKAAQAEQLAQAEAAASAAAKAATESAASDKEAVAALAAQRRDLESELERIRAETNARAEEKNAAQQALVELTGVRDKLAAEVAALTTKMQDAKKLTDELESMREAAAAQAETAGKAQALGTQVSELEARRAELEARRAELETKCQQLEANAANAETAARERAAAAVRAAEEAEEQGTQRQAEAGALTQKLEALRASVAELERRASVPPAPPAAAAHANVGPQGAHARAAAHLAAGEYEKAIEAYRQSLEANPQDASAAYQAGALLAEGGGDLRVAEELLTRAAELRPEHAATRYHLAVVRARRGKVVEGVELLTTLVRADSNNGEFIDQFIERIEKDAQNGNLNARFKLGVAYRELGRVEEALVTLQAIQHEPDYVVPCLIAIGLCLRRQGLDGAAAKRFAKAVETPGYAEGLYLEALYNLGDLYEAKGTQESLALALSSFEEVYARDVGYRDVGERVRVVKTNLGSAERLKVKRLPTRMADSQGNQ